MKNNKAISVEKTFEMSTEINIDINASVKKIMDLLTDSKNFINWNSTVTSIEGEIKQGETIKLISKLAPKRIFKLKVSEVTSNKLVFQDGFAPIFSGTRTFTIIEKPDGLNNFSMIEVFKGLMLPMIKNSLPDFKENFEQYAEDLKNEAEKT